MKKIGTCLAIVTLLSACGGGGEPPPRQGGDVPSDPPVVNPPPVDPPPVTPPPVDPPPVDPPPVDPPPAEPEFPSELHAVIHYRNRCEKPASGQTQGTLADELQFLRRWTSLTYLWYREVPTLDTANYQAPVPYFNALKTPQLTASGKPKDRFHFSYTNERWAELSRGSELGYGISWMRNADGKVPRTWRISMVQPGSAAARAGLLRGDVLQEVDGVDFVNTADNDSIAKLNAGLFPPKKDERHSFVVMRNGRRVTVNMVSAAVSISPVQNARVIDTPDGKVAYLTFINHNAPAEKPLIEAFALFRDAKVKELVLDLRYNGGGLLSVASQVAYMIAGPQQTQGKTFELTLVNDKSPLPDPMPFNSTSLGLDTSNPVPWGQALPALGLKRVSILTGPGTCSASESIINSLRGIDVEVNLVGGQTCGKPYAFVPTQNCENTYFTIQYQGVNHKGFGDYSDGFAPSCSVADDFGHALGDKREGLFAAALDKTRRSCAPAASARMRAGGEGELLVPVREQGSEISIVN
ncbi:S41 family peptidase [Massilia endophytica]|uniref:S41 family peptidase n=1 Tax=Massilia endophytica TaxID=2899220 RepID=UPI001E497D45|nr:S41 family peptidase [Massilia endophytica]UGQ46096.1 S41 family peptidase [Massilia endophytica]